MRALLLAILGAVLAACAPVGGGRRFDGLRIENGASRTLNVSVDHGVLDRSSGEFRPLGSLLQGEPLSRNGRVQVDLTAYQNLCEFVEPSLAVLRVRAMDSNYRSTLTSAFLKPESPVIQGGHVSSSAVTVPGRTTPDLSGRVRWEGYPNNLWLVVESGFSEIKPHDHPTSNPSGS